MVRRRSPALLLLVLCLAPLAPAETHEIQDPAWDETTGVRGAPVARQGLCHDASIDILHVAASLDGGRVSVEVEFEGDVARLRATCEGIPWPSVEQFYLITLGSDGDDLEVRMTVKGGVLYDACVYASRFHVFFLIATECIADVQVDGRFLRFDVPAAGQAPIQGPFPGETLAYEISGAIEPDVYAESVMDVYTGGPVSPRSRLYIVDAAPPFHGSL